MVERRKNPYQELREEALTRLQAAKVSSNSAFSDRNIVDSIRGKVGLPSASPWDDWDANSTSIFRGQLIAAIVEGGVEIAEPITETPNIMRGLDRLLGLQSWLLGSNLRLKVPLKVW